MSNNSIITDQYLEKVSNLFNRKSNPKIAAGGYLLNLKNSGDYRFIGNGYNTWNEFLKSEWVKMPYSTAYRYLKIAEKYIGECELTIEELEGHDTWSLTYIANKVNKENIKEWLAFINNNSRQDVINKIKNESIGKKCE
jgi:hypothetical protein